MKKTIIVVLLISLCCCTFADEIVTVDLEEMDEEDRLAYLFFYGYEAIFQEACKGAFLALNPEDLDYIGGWRTEQTPEDFCTEIPVGTIATIQGLPMGVAKTMFALLNDKETVAKLDGLKYDSIYVVCMFLPVEDMVVENSAYNYAKRLLEKEVSRHGIEPSVFYEYMANKGISQESMVYTMYMNEATASEIVLDYLGMVEAEKEHGTTLTKMHKTIGYVCLGSLGVLAILLIVLWLHNMLVKKKLEEAEAQAEIDQHNAGI
jgi:hypothetical protein